MVGRRLTPTSLGRIDQWAAHEALDCLYFLADAAEAATAALAEEAGFRLVDVRLTLARPGGGGRAVTPAASAASSPNLDSAPAIRAAREADLPALRRLAAASHHDSRFYRDPNFGAQSADALFERWIEGSLRDDAGTVLLAEQRGDAILGYVTAAVKPDGAGEIGLFAVAAAARGAGLGGRLLAAALQWLDERGAGPVRVVTQGRNVGAQRIYQRAGFLTESLELWFHRWTPAAIGGTAT